MIVKMDCGLLRASVHCFLGHTKYYRYNKSTLSRTSSRSVCRLVMASSSNPHQHATSRVEIIAVGPHKCETIRLRPSNVNDTHINSKRIVIVPGNPGIVEYYEDFAAALWDRLEGEVDVVCLGLVGHAGRRGLFPKGKVWTMHDQVDHVRQYLSEHCADVNSVQLVGHSIGAYFALEGLRKHPNLVQNVVGVYPYLTNNPQSEEQRFCKFLVNNRVVVFIVAVLADLIGRVHLALRRFLLLGLTESFLMGPKAASLTAVAMTRYDAVQNMCHMGRTELDFLDQPPDWELLEAYAERVSFVFNKANDYWAPLWLKKDIEARLPMLNTYLDPEYDHMFCCSEQGSKDIARLLGEVVLPAQQINSLLLIPKPRSS